MGSTAADVIKTLAESAWWLEFAFRKGRGMWPKLDRYEVAQGMLERVADPNKIHQRQTSFCGPACFIRSVIVDTPELYTKAVVDLYETGRAQIRHLNLRPRDEIRQSAATGNIHPVDYLVLASLRDEWNSFLSPVGRFPDLASITVPGDVEDWFDQAGYHDVTNDASVTGSLLPVRVIQVAKMNEYIAKGYKVLMFIDSDMLDSKEQDSNSLWPDHWVGLLTVVMADNGPWSPQKVIQADYHPATTFDVFTWGKRKSLPDDASNPMAAGNFLEHYYGYVAAHP